MEKLYDKLDNLKKTLDESETITKLRELIKEINSNKELVSLIEKYNKTHDERIKQEILKYDIFLKYKHQETELNFLILEINQELKKITKKDKCDLWK